MILMTHHCDQPHIISCDLQAKAFELREVMPILYKLLGSCEQMQVSPPGMQTVPHKCEFTILEWIPFGYQTLYTIILLDKAQCQCNLNGILNYSSTMEICQLILFNPEDVSI